MKNQFIKNFVCTVTVTLLLVSCEKERIGSLATYDITEPYYPELSFEEEWTTFIEPSLGPHVYHNNDQLFLANPNCLIYTSPNRGVIAFKPQTGDFIWQSEFADSKTSLMQADMIATNDKLIFFNRHGITTLDLFTGSHLGYMPYTDFTEIEDEGLAYVSHENYILLLTADGSRFTDFYSPKLYKIDPSIQEAKLMIEVDSGYVGDYPSYSRKEGNKHIFINPETNTAYFRVAKTNKQHDVPVVIYGLDLDDDSVMSYDMGVIEESDIFAGGFYFPFYIYDNRLYTNYHSRIIVTDLEQKNFLRELKGENLIPFESNLIVTAVGTARKTDSFNRIKLSPQWSNYALDLDLRTDNVIIESNIIVDFSMWGLSLFDINDGQMLVRSQIRPLEDIWGQAGSLVVLPSDDLVIMIGRYSDDGRTFIKSFKSPINL